jgi:hypothetical protein
MCCRHTFMGIILVESDDIIMYTIHTQHLYMYVHTYILCTYYCTCTPCVHACKCIVCTYTRSTYIYMHVYMSVIINSKRYIKFTIAVKPFKSYTHGILKSVELSSDYYILHTIHAYFNMAAVTQR